jgi:hypothetical protein
MSEDPEEKTSESPLYRYFMTLFIRLMHNIFGHNWEEIPVPAYTPWGKKDPNRRTDKCKCGKWRFTE